MAGGLGMSTEVKTVTFSLRDARKAPPKKRAKAAINLLRRLAKRHGKAEVVKISTEVAKKIWEKGARNPPRKLKVVLEKEEDTVYVRLEGEKKEEE